MALIEEIIENIAKKFAENNGEPNRWTDYLQPAEDWITAIGDAGYEVVEQA